MLRGFSIPQEVKDLIRTLQKSGVDVYIVSGSFLDAIVPSVDGRSGVDIPEANVFAIHMKTDAQGRLAGWADERLPFPGASSKPDVIRKHIAVRYHGKGPMLVAGDAAGDYAMLTSFADMDVGLVFDTRPKPDTPLGKLISSVRAGTADKRFLVQGRDETAPGLRKSSESIIAPFTIFGAPPRP